MGDGINARASGNPRRLGKRQARIQNGDPGGGFGIKASHLFVSLFVGDEGCGLALTAGTGSECQSAALIADEKTHEKMACLDPKATARIAILDPRLTLSQPTRVTACTGIDAIAHAAETAVTKKRNPLSLMFSHQAFKLCMASFPQILSNPNDLE